VAVTANQNIFKYGLI